MGTFSVTTSNVMFIKIIEAIEYAERATNSIYTEDEKRAEQGMGDDRAEREAQRRARKLENVRFGLIAVLQEAINKLSRH